MIRNSGENLSDQAQVLVMADQRMLQSLLDVIHGNS
jgi:hypothetical protein